MTCNPKILYNTFNTEPRLYFTSAATAGALK